MNNEKISQKQAIVMIIMYIIGSSSLMVMGLEAKMDIWLAILLAMAVGALIMLIYARLLSLLPGKDFYDTLEFFLGKIGSKIFLFIITWFAFDLCAIVLRSYGQFVVTVGLPETPLVVAIFMIMIICAFAVRSGIEVIGRWSSQFVIFLIAFLFISVLLVSQNMNISNLLPVFDNGFAPIARGAFGVIAFPFAETVVFLLVFPAFKKDVSIKKVFLKGLFIGGGIILITSLTDMLVLGTNLSENDYYPTFSTMATVHYGDFLQRLEVLAAIVFIIAIFLKISILLFAASKGTAKLLGFQDHKFIVIPIAFLVVNLALISFDSMIFFHEWIFKAFPYYACVFEIVIPIILWIIIEIKNRKNKRPQRKS